MFTFGCIVWCRAACFVFVQRLWKCDCSLLRIACADMYPCVCICVIMQHMLTSAYFCILLVVFSVLCLVALSQTCRRIVFGLRHPCQPLYSWAHVFSKAVVACGIVSARLYLARLDIHSHLMGLVGSVFAHFSVHLLSEWRGDSWPNSRFTGVFWPKICCKYEEKSSSVLLLLAEFCPYYISVDLLNLRNLRLVLLYIFSLPACLPV